VADLTLDADALEVLPDDEAEGDFDDALAVAARDDVETEAAELLRETDDETWTSWVRHWMLEAFATHLPGQGALAWLKRKFDANLHPRWPEGTPGGKGGEFMQVGERFLWNGKPWEIASFQNGKVYAHLATGKATDVELRAFTPKQIKVGFLALEGISKAPPAKVPTAKQYSADMPGTIVIDPFVDSASHDPSIAPPQGFSIPAESWKRFGKVDQERIHVLMERFGAYSPNKSKKLIDAIKQEYDYKVQQLVSSAISSQYGGSSGNTISLTGAFTSGHGSLEQQKKMYEEAKLLLEDTAAAIQWDVYNRVKAPDVCMFHWGHTDASSQKSQLVDQGIPIMSAYSMSTGFTTTHGFGPTLTAVPIAIRHVQMHTHSGGVYVDYHAEDEITTGHRMKVDDRALIVNYSSMPSDVKSYLSKHANKQHEPVSGELLVNAKRAMTDPSYELPVPPEPPGIMAVPQPGVQSYEQPPGNIVVEQIGDPATIFGLGYAGGWTAEEATKPANEHSFQAGDLMEGLKGTRYLIIEDTSSPTGLRYVKIDPSSGMVTTKSFPLSGDQPFRKLDGKVQMPVKETDVGWQAMPAEEKAALKPIGPPVKTMALTKGALFAADGKVFRVEQPSTVTGGKPVVVDVDTGKEFYVNSGFKTSPLAADGTYVPPGTEKPYEPVPGEMVLLGKVKPQRVVVFQGPHPDFKDKFIVSHPDAYDLESTVGLDELSPLAKFGADVPQVDDAFTHDGKKYVISSILKDGTVRAKPSGGKVEKFPPDHPSLKGVYSPGIYEIGDKQKVGSFEAGELLSGSDKKVRPYLVLSQKGKQTSLLNLETGEISKVSSNVSRALLKPASSEAPQAHPAQFPDKAVVENLVPGPTVTLADIAADGGGYYMAYNGTWHELWKHSVDNVWLDSEVDPKTGETTKEALTISDENGELPTVIGEVSVTKLVPKSGVAATGELETKPLAAFPEGADAWTLGGQHGTVVFPVGADPYLHKDDGTHLYPASELYTSDPLGAKPPAKPKVPSDVTPGNFDLSQWQEHGEATVGDMEPGTVFLSATGLPLLLKSKPSSGGSAIALHNGKKIKNLPLDKPYKLLVQKSDLAAEPTVPAGLNVGDSVIAEDVPVGTHITAQPEALTVGSFYTKITGGWTFTNSQGVVSLVDSAPSGGNYFIHAGPVLDHEQLEPGNVVPLKALEVGDTFTTDVLDNSTAVQFWYEVAEVGTDDKDPVVLLKSSNGANYPATGLEWGADTQVTVKSIGPGNAPTVTPAAPPEDFNPFDLPVPAEDVAFYLHPKSSVGRYKVADVAPGALVQSKDGTFFKVLDTGYFDAIVVSDGEKLLKLSGGNIVKVVKSQQVINAFDANDESGGLPGSPSALSGVPMPADMSNNATSLGGLVSAGLAKGDYLYWSGTGGLSGMWRVDDPQHSPDAVLATKVETGEKTALVVTLTPSKRLLLGQSTAATHPEDASPGQVAADHNLEVGHFFFDAAGHRLIVVPWVAAPQSKTVSPEQADVVAFMDVNAPGELTYRAAGELDELATPGGFTPGMEVTSYSTLVGGNTPAVVVGGKVVNGSDFVELRLPDGSKDIVKPEWVTEKAPETPVAVPEGMKKIAKPSHVHDLPVGAKFTIGIGAASAKTHYTVVAKHAQTTTIDADEGGGPWTYLKNDSLSWWGSVDPDTVFAPASQPPVVVKKGDKVTDHFATFGDIPVGTKWHATEGGAVYEKISPTTIQWTSPASGETKTKAYELGFTPKIWTLVDVPGMTAEPESKDPASIKTFGDLDVGDRYWFDNKGVPGSNYLVVAKDDESVTTIAPDDPLHVAPSVRALDAEFASPIVKITHGNPVPAQFSTGGEVQLDSFNALQHGAHFKASGGVWMKQGGDSAKLIALDPASPFEQMASPGEVVGGWSGEEVEHLPSYAPEDFHVTAVGSISGGVASIDYHDTVAAKDAGLYRIADKKTPLGELPEFSLVQTPNGKLGYLKDVSGLKRIFELGKPGGPVKTSAKSFKKVSLAVPMPEPGIRELDDDGDGTLGDVPIGGFFALNDADYMVIGKSSSAVHAQKLETGQIGVMGTTGFGAKVTHRKLVQVAPSSDVGGPVPSDQLEPGDLFQFGPDKVYTYHVTKVNSADDSFEAEGTPGEPNHGLKSTYTFEGVPEVYNVVKGAAPKTTHLAALPDGAKFKHGGHVYTKTGTLGVGAYSVESETSSLNHLYNSQVEPLDPPDAPPAPGNTMEYGDLPEGTLFTVTAQGDKVVFKKDGDGATVVHSEVKVFAPGDHVGSILSSGNVGPVTIVEPPHPSAQKFADLKPGTLFKGVGAEVTFKKNEPGDEYNATLVDKGGYTGPMKVGVGHTITDETPVEVVGHEYVSPVSGEDFGPKLTVGALEKGDIFAWEPGGDRWEVLRVSSTGSVHIKPVAKAGPIIPVKQSSGTQIFDRTSADLPF
jgi:hypothetical protein